MTGFSGIHMNSERAMIELSNLFGQPRRKRGEADVKKRSKMEVNRWKLEIDFVV